MVVVSAFLHLINSCLATLNRRIAVFNTGCKDKGGYTHCSSSDISGMTERNTPYSRSLRSNIDAAIRLLKREAIRCSARLSPSRSRDGSRYLAGSVSVQGGLLG